MNNYDIYVECHFGENDLNTCVHMYMYSSRYYIHVHATLKKTQSSLDYLSYNEITKNV